MLFSMKYRRTKHPGLVFYYGSLNRSLSHLSDTRSKSGGIFFYPIGLVPLGPEGMVICLQLYGREKCHVKSL